jgi:hypothetical protein
MRLFGRDSRIEPRPAVDRPGIGGVHIGRSLFRIDVLPLLVDPGENGPPAGAAQRGPGDLPGREQPARVETRDHQRVAEALLDRKAVQLGPV